MNFKEHHFVWLFFALMAFILLSAVGEETYFFSSILYTVVLLAAVYGTIESKRYWVPVVLAGPAIILNWVYRLTDSEVVDIAANVATVAFLIYVIAVVLRFIARSKQVNLNVLFAGLSFYMLLGLAWVSVYLLVEEFYPGSFTGGAIEGASRIRMVSELLYFSFVTLTTLGYGDISPASPVARSLAALEAVTGVLSLAIIVARLVSAWKHEE